jgi:hypothetical protein
MSGETSRIGHGAAARATRTLRHRVDSPCAPHSRRAPGAFRVAPVAGLGFVAFVLALGVALTGTLPARRLGAIARSRAGRLARAVAAAAWTEGCSRGDRGQPPERVSGFGVLIRALRGRPAVSRLAGYCLPVVVASGVWHACVQVPTFALLWTRRKAVALLLKVVPALLLAFLGAVNATWFRRVLARAGRDVADGAAPACHRAFRANGSRSGANPALRLVGREAWSPGRHLCTASSQSPHPTTMPTCPRSRTRDWRTSRCRTACGRRRAEGLDADSPQARRQGP